jgi:CRP-like cAMP-binding protein
MQHPSKLIWPTSEAQGALVSHSALLARLSSQPCGEIIAYARNTTFAHNESLFSQDQPIDKLIMIRAGRLKLTQVSPDGKEVILWLNGPGDAVGIHADADGTNHSCSARAMERCQVFIWESYLLQEFISRYPRIQINLRRILASHLSELEERFREIASERVPIRLALALIRFLKLVGKEGREGVKVAITREELAQLTGTTQFTISRILSKWAKFGFVALQRGSVVIINPDCLRRHAGLDRQYSRRGSRPIEHNSSPRMISEPDFWENGRLL